jgi:hypothetical protein
MARRMAWSDWNGAKPRARWYSRAFGPVAKHREHCLLIDGGRVLLVARHCGHPTANYPYHLVAWDAWDQTMIDRVCTGIKSTRHTWGRLLDCQLEAEAMLREQLPDVWARVDLVGPKGKPADPGQADLFEV